MVEAVSKVSLRGQRQRERMTRIRAARPQGGIRVVPTDDKYRKLLRHPNGMGFRPDGSVEWPNDRFTKRRIAEGVIKVEGASPGEVQPDKRRRQHEDRS
jgi:hypothetical protein